MKTVLPSNNIQRSIFLVRGRRAMLDAHLAVLYGVTTFNLNKAVRRNTERFPDDFMFQLTSEEYQHLIFQFGISSGTWGGRRHLPFVFTQEGVAMLSSVLKSARAARVNVAIMRAFVRVREILNSHPGLSRRIEQLEKQMSRHDRRFKKHGKEIREIFQAIQALIQQSEPRDQNVLKPTGF